MNKKSFSIVCLLAFCLYANGQENFWPLQKCLQIGMQNNIDRKIKQLEVKRAQKNNNSILNQMLPSLSFTGIQSYTYGSTIDPATNGRISSNILNDNFYLNASMNLIDFSAFTNAQKSKLDIEKAKAEKEIIENEYKIQILDSYYQALFSQELLTIQNAELKNATFNLNRIQKEVNIGSKSTSDLYDMQLMYSQEEKRIIETEQLLHLQKTQLFQLINLENKATLLSEVVLMPYLPNETLEITPAKSNNPKIEFAELDYKSSLKNINLQRAKKLPTLKGYYSFSTFYYKTLNQANIGLDNFNAQLGNNKNQQLGLQVDVPLFNGFRTQKNIAVAKIESEKSQLALEKERQTINRQIEIENENKTNYAQLQTHLKKIESFAKDSYSTTQAKFASGKIDAISFSVVKNLLLNSEYDLLKNKLQLEFIDLKINLIKNNDL